jgi:hypothetical protein
MALDLNHLKQIAKVGRVDRALRQQVFANLKQDTGPLYELLDTAGWIAAHNGPSDEELAIVESFLDFKQDTMIPALALMVLCVRWGLDDRYADRIKQFLDASIDPEGAMHLAGATSAGKLLRRCLDRNM